MTFAVSESSTDQYQRGDGGTGVGVEVGSGVKVAVAVFSTGRVAAGWVVDVGSTCSIGADVDTAGLAQADRNITIATIRVKLRFMFPLFHIKQKGGQDVRPKTRHVMLCRCERLLRSNPQLDEEIASPCGFDTGGKIIRPTQPTGLATTCDCYLFNVLYLTRWGVKSLPNFSSIIVS